MTICISNQNVTQSNFLGNITNKMASSPESIEEPPVAIQIECQPCKICSRTFRPETLVKHEKICEKNVTKRRKVFNSLRQRVEGTDLALFHMKVYKKTSTPSQSQTVSKVPTTTPPDEAKERSSSPESPVFKVPTTAITDKREKKEKPKRVSRPSVTIPAVASSQKEKTEKSDKPVRAVRSLPMMNAVEACPHCERKFGAKSYERHVIWCQEKAACLPAICLKPKQVGKERLEARLKYCASTSIKKSSQKGPASSTAVAVTAGTSGNQSSLIPVHSVTTSELPVPMIKQVKNKKLTKRRVSSELSLPTSKPLKPIETIEPKLNEVQEICISPTPTYYSEVETPKSVITPLFRSPKPGSTKTEDIIINPQDIEEIFKQGELFSPDDEIYEEYKQLEQDYIIDRSLQQKQQKPKQQQGQELELQDVEDEEHQVLYLSDRDLDQDHEIINTESQRSLRKKTSKVNMRKSPLGSSEEHDVDEESSIVSVNSACSKTSQHTITMSEKGGNVPVVAMFCHNCGKTYPFLTAKFCMWCGAKRVVIK